MFHRLFSGAFLSVVKVVDQYHGSWDLWWFRKQSIHFWPTHAVGSWVCSQSMQFAHMATCHGISGKLCFAVSIKYWTMTAPSSGMSFRCCAEDWDLVIPPSSYDLRVPWQQLCSLARKVGARGVSALSLAIYLSYASFVHFWHSWNSHCLSAQHLVGVLIWRGRILFSQSCKHHSLSIPQTAAHYAKYIK